MNPEVNDVLSTVLNGLLTAGLIAVIGMLIALWRWTKALYDIHLGPSAIDSETGLPRWYVRENRITDALTNLAAAFKIESESNRKVIAANTKVMDALLREIQVDRQVTKLVSQRQHSEQEN